VIGLIVITWQDFVPQSEHTPSFFLEPYSSNVLLFKHNLYISLPALLGNNASYRTLLPLCTVVLSQQSGLATGNIEWNLGIWLKNRVYSCWYNNCGSEFSWYISYRDLAYVSNTAASEGKFRMKSDVGTIFIYWNITFWLVKFHIWYFSIKIKFV